MTQDAPDAGAAASDVPAKTSMSEAELRRYIDERFATFDGRLEAGDQRMKNIEDGLAKNTAMTSNSFEMLTAIRDLLDVGRAGLRALGWIGEAAKWIAKIVTPFAALWGLYNAWKHGAPPAPK